MSRVYALDPGDINSFRNVELLVGMLGKALNILVFSAGAIFIAYLIFGAYKFATAQGDPKGIAGAKQSLTYAVIGLCIVIGVFAINSIVVGILGLGSSNPELKSPGGIFGSLKTGINGIVSWIDDNTPTSSGLTYSSCVSSTCTPVKKDCIIVCGTLAGCLEGCESAFITCKVTCDVLYPRATGPR